MRRIAPALALLAVAVTPAAVLAAPSGTEGAGTQALAVPAVSLVFTGHGYGHGLGLSQWGAKGMAAAGFPYDQILQFYYPGTTLTVSAPTKVRVLFYDGVKSIAIRSDADFTVQDGAGGTTTIPAGTATVSADLTLSSPGLAPRALTGPLVFHPGAAPLGIHDHYRGDLAVSVVNGALRVVNVVGLEDYVKGVVTAEMPYTWPAAALQAQAVAARTYALASLRPKADFDLWDDSRSEAYGGVESETPAGIAAVQASTGQILAWNGKPISAMFSSSNGGATASAAETYPSSVSAPPYLAAAPDPFDVASPWHDWGPVVVGGGTAGKALGVPGALTDLRLVLGPSGRVASAVAVGAKGPVTVGAGTLRSALGLRSTWFAVGVATLARPSATASAGGPVVLQGTLRGIADPVTLQSHVAGGLWTTVGPVTPAADGSFTVTVAPVVTTTYRLVIGKIAGAPLGVPVGPSVTLATAGDGSLSGTVGPQAAGTPVQLQQLRNGAWTTVATAVPDPATGAFRVAPPPGGGTFRAFVPATAGLAAATSGTVAA